MHKLGNILIKLDEIISVIRTDSGDVSVSLSNGKEFLFTGQHADWLWNKYAKNNTDVTEPDISI